MLSTALALDLIRFERTTPTRVMAEMGVKTIPHSYVRRHKRQAIRDACTSRQALHRKIGLMAMFSSLVIFVGLVIVALQVAIPIAYQDVLSYAIAASLVGIPISWMYRDSFHPGRWEIYKYSQYLSVDRTIPQEVEEMHHRVGGGLPEGSPEIHRHGKDPFLAFVVKWWIFRRTYFVAEWDENGTVV